MSRAAFFVCLLVEVSAFAPSIPLLKDSAIYAYAAYCNDGSVMDWDCYWCKQASVPVDVRVNVSDPTYDTFGYVGMVERDGYDMILVSFRGSCSLKNFVQDAKALLKTYPQYPSARVHSGFWQAWENVRPPTLNMVSQLMTYLMRTLPQDKPLRVQFVGHSLGAAVATLSAMSLKYYLPGMGRLNVSLVTFGGPRVGDREFANYLHSMFPNEDVNSSSAPTGPTNAGTAVTKAVGSAQGEVRSGAWAASKSAVASGSNGSFTFSNYQTTSSYVRVTHERDIIPHLAPMKLSPYIHAPQELFVTDDGNIKICDGVDGEDGTCSNKYSLFSVSDHMQYMGISWLSGVTKKCGVLPILPSDASDSEMLDGLVNELGVPVVRGV